MKPLAGKTALVTGGSRGIGRAITERLSADGARVAFGYHRSKDEAMEVAGATGAHPLRADLGVHGDVLDLVAQADEVLGGLDALVNNAGVWLPGGRFDDADEEAYDRVMAVNAKSVYFALHHAAPRMRDGGRVVNMSSIATGRPTPGNAVYAASKAAVEQFTAIAAQELGPRRITVNCVAPGAVDTALLRGSLPPQLLARTARNTPFARLGTGEDVAGVVAFLLGPDAGWVTGQTITAAGGLL